ncbi:hypothetical protein PSECIP111951_02574 [Pseudoalteromonas holothuriae]|uniref:Endonuclease/exonuclease/phosphatase domain-containing protein n=1 Tax=Pseudoalteromonas holothuriae TaxID=2963714 RepID=A0A9W4R182_9GAMM|nr:MULTISPECIES: endonuclease/exonuclease/phosphatase family protein [unclassified Pseudoalteromonas]CAH9061853.1 hypothetical protein PSECIP111951_02574 [Pseudoalteromonas sp. CIP111951]CAH9062147.1 hypothetical protein PSECIP111854_02954 [Pseudoalteromonas sp. CIP111854]
MRYLLIGIYTILMISAFFVSSFGYIGDIVDSLRAQWLMLGVFTCILGLLYSRLLFLSLFAISCCLLVFHLRVVVQEQSEKNYHNQLTIKQINLRYYNQSVINELAKLNEQTWDLLILQEFNDNNTALFDKLKPEYYKFGSDEHIGFPMGLGIISRYPLISKKVVYTQMQKVGYLEVDILVGNSIITVFAVHPPSPRSKKDWLNRNELLLVVYEAVKKLEGHWLISGDFNIVPWSKHFPFTNMPLCSHSLVNNRSWQYLNWLPSIVAGLPIDNCVVSEHQNITNVSVELFKGSDHKLLSFQLRF